MSGKEWRREVKARRRRGYNLKIERYDDRFLATVQGPEVTADVFAKDSSEAMVKGLLLGDYIEFNRNSKAASVTDRAIACLLDALDNADGHRVLKLCSSMPAAFAGGSEILSCYGALPVVAESFAGVLRSLDEQPVDAFNLLQAMNRLDASIHEDAARPIPSWTELFQNTDWNFVRSKLADTLFERAAPFHLELPSEAVVQDQRSSRQHLLNLLGLQYKVGKNLIKSTQASIDGLCGRPVTSSEYLHRLAAAMVDTGLNKLIGIRLEP